MLNYKKPALSDLVMKTLSCDIRSAFFRVMFSILGINVCIVNYIVEYLNQKHVLTVYR